MEKLKQIRFTENDFKLLMKSIDFLPEQNLITTLIDEVNNCSEIKSEEDAGKRMKKVRQKLDNVSLKDNRVKMKDESIIIQSKLLHLKKFLIANNLME